MSSYRFEKNFFEDGYNIYDEKNNKVGTAELDFFSDGYTLYDNKGKKIGTADRNFFTDGFTIYDKKGKKLGRANHNFWTDGYTMEDNHGNKIADTEPEYCYIATCVYGSYDCPEVWTLRRFRDYYLYKHFLGKLFIKFYYTTSPTLVKLFGKTTWFKSLGKKSLDKFVKRLNEKGYDNSKYSDK